MNNTILQTSNTYKQFAEKINSKQSNSPSVYSANVENTKDREQDNSDTFVKNNLKEQANKRKLIKIGIVLAAAGGLFCLGKFLQYYKECVNALKAKKEVLPDINTKDEFYEFIQKKPYSLKERERYTKIYFDNEKFQSKWIGKFHIAVTEFSEFMRRNFYNY